MPVEPTTSAEVAFYGVARSLCGQPRVSVDVTQRSSVRQLIDCLAQAHGERVRDYLLTKSGTLQPGVQVFVEGQPVRSLDEQLPEVSRAQIKILVLTISAGG